MEEAVSVLTSERPPTPAERVAEWRYRHTLATWSDPFPDVTDDLEPELPDESPEPAPEWWREFSDI